jgi:RNA polymerase sigma factor (sigma-70 family)
MPKDDGGRCGRPRAGSLVEACLIYQRELKSRSLRLIRLSGGSVEDALDLVSDTYLRALTYPKDVGEITNLLGYVLRIMRHIWIDKQRRAQRMIMESLDAMQDDPTRQGEIPTVESDASRIERTERLRQVLNSVESSLTSEEKGLLRAILSGLEIEDVAAELNEDKYRTAARWYGLRAKVIRLARQRIDKSKGKGAGK